MTTTQRAARARYEASDQRRASRARYARSANRKAALARYRASAKGHATHARYQASARGHAVKARYEASAEGRARRASYAAATPERYRKRVRMGERYLGMAATVDQAVALNAHIRSRRHGFTEAQRAEAAAIVPEIRRTCVSVA